jgi:hypothetical protein
VIVPGHGKVMHDDSGVRALAGFLETIDSQARAAAMHGEAFDDWRQSVDIGDFRSGFAGDDKMLNFIFDEFLLQPVLRGSYDAAIAE